MKMSLAFTQSILISVSSSCTCFPGRAPFASKETQVESQQKGEHTRRFATRNGKTRRACFVRVPVLEDSAATKQEKTRRKPSQVSCQSQTHYTRTALVRGKQAHPSRSAHYNNLRQLHKRLYAAAADDAAESLKASQPVVAPTEGALAHKTRGAFVCRDRPQTMGGRTEHVSLQLENTP